MDQEPADYVCLVCSLRFKNSGTFEKHKRKFCQGQGRSNNNTWAPSSKSNRRISNDQPEFPLKTASGADFWVGKPVSERLVLSSPAIYQVPIIISSQDLFVSFKVMLWKGSDSLI